MGVYDRDYYREDAPPPGVLGGHGMVCKRIIATTVVVFILQLVTTGDAGQRAAGITAWLDLDPGKILQGQLWRLVTYAFCHDVHSITHIIFNMLGLWWFGAELESMYGPREFLKFYLTAAAMSGLVFCGMQPFLGSLSPAIGASGAVMAVMAVYTLYFPRRVVYVLFIIPVELWLLMVFFVAYDLHPVLLNLGGARFSDQVAHTAHLGGLLYGLLYKHYDLRYSRLIGPDAWASLKRTVRRRVTAPPEVKLYQPQEELAPEFPAVDFNQRVDEILAKISDQGESSLTAEERELLKEASRRYKHR
jgi:membrane associated rhomboid family serine protease